MRLHQTGLLFALLALACTTAKVQPMDSDSAATDSEPQTEECVPEPIDGQLFVPGPYITTIDEALYNNCENAAGKGLHIHVGEDTPMTVIQDQSCIELVNDPGNEQELHLLGTSDGESFETEGLLLLEIGTCTIGITAHMTGTMESGGAFTYTMVSVADVYEEYSPDACSFIVGDTQNHTFPALPCDNSWEGSGYALQ